VARKEGRMTRFAEGAIERVTTAEPRPGSALEAQETNAALLQLIAHLPPNQQEVIRLKFQNGFSYKEISRITALSVGNVGFLIHSAVTRLRREFAAQPP
jgi:RNA polymerase sigma-70 factor (ECF subfamily)